jgi:hypothetical protein
VKTFDDKQAEGLNSGHSQKYLTTGTYRVADKGSPKIFADRDKMPRQGMI